MKLRDVGAILIENNRSRAYLQRMEFHGMAPSSAIVLQNSSGVPTPGQRADDLVRGGSAGGRKTTDFTLNEREPIKETLERLEVPSVTLATTDINSEEVARALQSQSESVWIYSGPGGALVKKHMFALGKRYLHIHPGIVPEFRGSTTIYYSLLQEGSCGASAIFLSEEIDQGPLIATKSFPPPIDRRTIDYLYDPLIRSELLVDVLSVYRSEGRFDTQPQPHTGNPFYIMHPVLRHLCVLASNR